MTFKKPILAFIFIVVLNSCTSTKSYLIPIKQDYIFSETDSDVVYLSDDDIYLCIRIVEDYVNKKSKYFSITALTTLEELSGITRDNHELGWAGITGQPSQNDVLKWKKWFEKNLGKTWEIKKQDISYMVYETEL